MTKKWWHLLALIGLVSCAGTQRSCAAGCAESYGADWMVAQYSMDGTPIMCWKLNNTSISNEQGTDGIYWLHGGSGNLVHISGWYNRVQVSGNNWAHAAENLGVEEKNCKDGVYLPTAVATKKKAKAKPVEDTEESESESEGPPPGRPLFPPGSFPGEPVPPFRPGQ